MNRTKYSINRFNNLASLDREYSNEERTEFNSYLDEFGTMMDYEEYLTPPLRKIASTYRDEMTDWSMDDNALPHQKEAVSSYESKIRKQEVLSNQLVNARKLELVKKRDDYGFANVVHIFIIIALFIGLLVVLTFMAM